MTNIAVKLVCAAVIAVFLLCSTPVEKWELDRVNRVVLYPEADHLYIGSERVLILGPDRWGWFSYHGESGAITYEFQHQGKTYNTVVEMQLADEYYDYLGWRLPENRRQTTARGQAPEAAPEATRGPPEAPNTDP